MDFQNVEGLTDSTICAYLVDMINDDDKYDAFITFLTSFDKYTMPCRQSIESFMFYLEHFSKTPTDADQCRLISHLFVSTFRYLERVRTVSTIKRNFIDDYKKKSTAAANVKYNVSTRKHCVDE